MADIRVDAKGRDCPEPTIMLSRAAASAVPGQTIELISTDRGSLLDVPAWVEESGHEMVAMFEDRGEFHFMVEVR